MRVALYARVSTRDRDQNPETQLRPLRAHAAEHGYTVLGEFVDKASATDHRGRRQWRRVLELADKHHVDLVLIWRLDRAFRSVLDGAQTLERLRLGGSAIRSLQEPWIDTTTPMGEAMFHITVVWASLEKATISERVKAGMDRARAEGKHVGRNHRDWTPEQHQLWPKIVAGVSAGTMTRREAAKRLGVGYQALQGALAGAGIDGGLRKGGREISPSANSVVAA